MWGIENRAVSCWLSRDLFQARLDPCPNQICSRLCSDLEAMKAGKAFKWASSSPGWDVTVFSQCSDWVNLPPKAGRWFLNYELAGSQKYWYPRAHLNEALAFQYFCSLDMNLPVFQKGTSNRDFQGCAASAGVFTSLWRRGNSLGLFWDGFQTLTFSLVNISSFPSGPSRRSDLESLGYCLLQWLCGFLPWSDELDKVETVMEKKEK